LFGVASPGREKLLWESPVVAWVGVAVGVGLGLGLGVAVAVGVGEGGGVAVAVGSGVAVSVAGAWEACGETVAWISGVTGVRASLVAAFAVAERVRAEPVAAASAAEVAATIARLVGWASSSPFRRKTTAAPTSAATIASPIPPSASAHSRS
jgi:hypothetical protein